MIPLTPKQRRELRAQAHSLHAVVSVGQHGLTPPVMHEIDVALRAHALVKVRVFSEDRGQREAMLARIAGELDAAPVQHLGKVLILWRAPEEKPVEPAARPARKPAKERVPAASRRRADVGTTRGTQATGRRARGPASVQEARREPDSHRRRPTPAVERSPRSGDDTSAPVARDRRRAAGPPDSPPGKRPGRESRLRRSTPKPASKARPKASPPLQASRTPTGKSAPNPRRRRRTG